MFWTGELIASRAPVRRRAAPQETPSTRATAAYLGLAIGDALGATVEFMTPNEIRGRHGIHQEIIGGGWLRLKAGQVTDDTTMSLALGEAIHANAGKITPLGCARAFDLWMRRKPGDIGNTGRRNLLLLRRTGQPAAPRSEHDAGNGAAMRVLPVALATWGRSEARAIAACQAQAHVTHHSAASDAACEFIVLALRDFLAGATLSEVVRSRVAPLVESRPEFAYRGRARRENPSGWIVETLQAVLQALVDGEGFEASLIDVVNRGGDADTTGAILGMLAGARYGLDAIPPRWLAALDPAVATACRAQARALIGAPCGSMPGTDLDHAEGSRHVHRRHVRFPR